MLHRIAVTAWLWRRRAKPAIASMGIVRTGHSDRMSQGPARTGESGGQRRPQSGGSARLKRLAGRSRIQVNRLEAAVATQNMKNPIV